MYRSGLIMIALKIKRGAPNNMKLKIKRKDALVQ